MSKLNVKSYEDVNEKIDPYEEDIILDMERVKNCLQTKTPDTIHIE